MLLIDVHAHLDHKLFKNDLDKVISDARKNNVKVIIANGLNPNSNRTILELAGRYDIIKAALGIYPIDALNIDVDKEIEFIRSNKNRIVAIGEVGLDYYQDTKHKEQQKRIFGKFIQLAEKIKKPIIVHSRKAEADTVEMLKSSRLKKVIMHCFSGNFKLVKEIQDQNWYFSIPCNIVRSKQFQHIVEKTNISQLLTESDAPFLSPYSGKRNEPSFVMEAVKKIAEIKQMDEEEVANNIFMNYQKCFF